MNLLKKFLMFVICLLSLLLLYKQVNAGAKKAHTIDELAAMFDSSSCKECHEEIYEQWEKSAHAYSLWGEGGRMAATLGSAITKGAMTWPYSEVKRIEDVKMKHLWPCFKCTLPQARYADDNVAQEIVKAIFELRNPKVKREIKKKDIEKLKKLNINCLVCHQEKAIVHKWVYGPPQRNAIYGSHNGEHPCEKYPILKKSPQISWSIFCGQCHGLGPNFELENPTQCPTLYGHYLFSYIARGGRESCQDCHMRKFHQGHLMPAYRVPEMVKVMAKAALDFNVDAHSYYWRKNKEEGVIPLAVIKVKMTSKAGHAFPDGCPTPNRLVLNVSAKTPSGKVIYKKTKLYLPFPARFGNHALEGRGGYEKCGMIAETCPQPFQTIKETFMIPFPYRDIKKGKKVVRELLSNEMDVNMELWYVPFGEMKGFLSRYNVLWDKITKKVTIKRIKNAFIP